MTRQLSEQQLEALSRTVVQGIESGSADMIAGAIRLGADLKRTTREPDSYPSSQPKKPPIHWAVLHFKQDVMDLMLKHCSADEPDADDATALMYALTQKKFECVETLMRAGADPLAQAKDGRVALDLARQISDSGKREHVLKLMLADYSAEKKNTKEFNAAAVISDGDTDGMTQITGTSRRNHKAHDNDDDTGGGQQNSKGGALKM